MVTTTLQDKVNNLIFKSYNKASSNSLTKKDVETIVHAEANSIRNTLVEEFGKLEIKNIPINAEKDAYQDYYIAAAVTVGVIIVGGVICYVSGYNPFYSTPSSPILYVNASPYNTPTKKVLEVLKEASPMDISPMKGLAQSFIQNIADLTKGGKDSFINYLGSAAKEVSSIGEREFLEHADDAVKASLSFEDFKNAITSSTGIAESLGLGETQVQEIMSATAGYAKKTSINAIKAAYAVYLGCKVVDSLPKVSGEIIQEDINSFDYETSIIFEEGLTCTEVSGNIYDNGICPLI